MIIDWFYIIIFIINLISVFPFYEIFCKNVVVLGRHLTFNVISGPWRKTNSKPLF